MAASRCVASILDACLTTPQDDASIPIDLSVGELVHPSALAHLGFKRTMLDDRGIGTHRFDGENRVLERADAVERLDGPFQSHAGPPVTAGCALRYAYYTSRHWPN
jgi:hypothetical protein